MTVSQVSALLIEGHANLRGRQAERTLNTKVEGVTVTGTFDLYYGGGVLTDYKSVSASAFARRGRRRSPGAIIG